MIDPKFLQVGQTIYATSPAVIDNGQLFVEAQVKRVCAAPVIAWSYGEPGKNGTLLHSHAGNWTPDLLFREKGEAIQAGKNLALDRVEFYQDQVERYMALAFDGGSRGQA